MIVLSEVNYLTGVFYIYEDSLLQGVLTIEDAYKGDIRIVCDPDSGHDAFSMLKKLSRGFRIERNTDG